MEINNKKEYKKVSKEIGWNFKKLNYTKNVLTDFDYWDTVEKFLDDSKIVLDVGCGSAQKTIQKLSAKTIYGIDLEKNMLKHAKQNLKQYKDKQNMFKFKIMNGHKKLKFKNNFFDVVISRHCGVNAKELIRVLKPHGVFVSEDIDKSDCQELKEFFSYGQSYNDEIPLSVQTKLQFINAGFTDIEIYEILEDEYYPTKEDLKYLLKRTPILNYYKNEKDDVILDKFIKKYTTEKGILLKRRLFGVIAKK